MGIPAPVSFLPLGEYLDAYSDVNVKNLCMALEGYLSKHQQTDLDIDTDHQVWNYRKIIQDFILVLEDEHTAKN